MSDCFSLPHTGPNLAANSMSGFALAFGLTCRGLVGTLRRKFAGASGKGAVCPFGRRFGMGVEAGAMKLRTDDLTGSQP